MQDSIIENSEVAREAVLTRLRQRYERLRQLARTGDRGAAETRPPQADRGLAANAVPLRSLAVRGHAGDA